MADFKMTQSETIKLINLYKQSEQLWNYKSHLYKRVDLKKTAWEEIAKEFKRDVRDVKNKLKSLRSAYVSEMKKVDETKKSGAAAEEVYQPHLFYFHAFSFLDDVIVLRKTKSNYVLDDTLERACEAKENDEYIEYVTPHEDTFFPRTCCAKSKKNQQSTSKYEEAINKIINSASQVSEPDDQDKFSDFGKSIASQLKDLSPIEASAAMADLQQNISSHLIRSLEKKQMKQQASSMSTSLESNDILHCAMVESEIFDSDGF